MENLGIDIKLIIAQILNFGLFFFIFKKFISGPMNQLASDERKKEKEKENALQTIKQEEALLGKKETDLRQKMNVEKGDLLKQAESEVEADRETIIKHSQEEAEKIISQARDQIKDEREAFGKEMKKQVIDASILIIDKSLRDYLTEEAQRELTKKILSNFSGKAS